MTVTDVTITTAPLTGGYRLPAFDLYRDIHKGIRSELFAVTAAAGCLDHTDPVAWLAFASHLDSVASTLEQHAAHEDDHIGPTLLERWPALAERVVAEHEALDGRFAAAVEIAHAGADAPPGEQRLLAHHTYLSLSSFTSAYLAHQELEELEITPMLETAIGPVGMLGIHTAIVGSIPPAEMAGLLTLMLPAMNVDDRTEMLGAMRDGAPAEVFAGVVGLARSVLDPVDFAQVSRRLGMR